MKKIAFALCLLLTLTLSSALPAAAGGDRDSGVQLALFQPRTISIRV